RDLRRRAFRSRVGGAVRRRRLHRGRVLVHVVDVVREPRGDDRAHAEQHVRRHTPVVGTRVRRRPDRRRARRGRVGEVPASERRGARHRRAPRTENAVVNATDTDTLPKVLFLCIHNAGRSQMALGWFDRLAAGRAVAWSGGSEPGREINPAAVAAMAEVGVDITAEFPKPWTDEIVRAADVVVTMGCGDACPFYPGKRYEDWALEDPAGRSIDAVRPIRDEIRARVVALLQSLAVDVA